MKKRDVIAISFFAFFYLTVGVLLTVFQDKVIYQPGIQDFATCFNFSDAEKVTYNGTRMYIQNPDKPLVVLYHGNAGSACDRKIYADIFTKAGYGYVVVEYTGYSNDPRIPSHETIKADVKNVVDYLASQHLTDITVVGESIGTAIASYHTSLSAPKKLLLISPMSSLADVASDRFWFYPTNLLVDNAFDSVTLLQPYQNPVTIIHGNSDSVIPYKLGEKLFVSLSTQKEFVTIQGGDHNDLFNYSETYDAINSFLGHTQN